jgi:hypothetical protein
MTVIDEACAGPIVQSGIPALHRHSPKWRVLRDATAFLTRPRDSHHSGVNWSVFLHD